MATVKKIRYGLKRIVMLKLSLKKDKIFSSTICEILPELFLQIGPLSATIWWIFIILKSMPITARTLKIKEEINERHSNKSQTKG